MQLVPSLSCNVNTKSINNLKTIIFYAYEIIKLCLYNRLAGADPHRKRHPEAEPRPVPDRGRVSLGRIAAVEVPGHAPDTASLADSHPPAPTPHRDSGGPPMMALRPATLSA